MNVDADRCDLLFRFMNNCRISCSVWQERENRNDNNGAPSEDLNHTNEKFLSDSVVTSEKKFFSKIQIFGLVDSK